MNQSLKQNLLLRIFMGAIWFMGCSAWAADSGAQRTPDAASTAESHGIEEPFVCPQVLPDGTPMTWGKEPEVTSSPVRSQIVLNGPWQFMPAVEMSQDWSEGPWGWIRVPGNWSPSWTEPGILIDCPTTPFWSKYYGAYRNDDDKPVSFSKQAHTLTAMWYRRQITVPASWAGRSVLVDVQWLSTDAEVYIDGKKAGEVAWPTGQVDITNYIEPGKTHTLRMRVAAIADQGFTWSSMGTEEGMAKRSKKGLKSRGLVGDVLLVSQPQGAVVTDVFVQPSVRKKQITLDIEVSGIKQAGTATITADMVGPDGKTEKQFRIEQTLKAEPTQRFTVSWPWADPKLWDYGAPNLYTVQLHVDGQNIRDIYAQRFGFREFWIAGRDIFLNEKPFRLRPFSLGGGPMATARTYRLALQDMKNLGANITEIWPEEIPRGGEYYDDQIYRIADEEGFPIMGRAGSACGLIWEKKWKDPVEQANWIKSLEVVLRRSRNCPSIMLWVHSANAFGYANDISPMMMGARGTVHETGKQALFQQGLDVCEAIRKIDPTRPVTTHQGGYVGDIHTGNQYLNLIPLQEREEWLSWHVKNADMPFCAVEFGAPDELSFHRNRGDWENSKASEPWHSEFSAIYLGPEAYRLETPWQLGDLRAAYKETKNDKGNTTYRWWDWRYSRRSDSYPNMQAVISLFIKNTTRSWRAAGHTGGVLLWTKAHGWENNDCTDNPYDFRPWNKKLLKGRVDYDTFQPGTRGPWQPYAPKNVVHPYSPEYQTELPAGKAVRANFQPTLAYIAGVPDFYDKSHLLRTGQEVEKQLVIINDARQDLPYHATITVQIGDQPISAVERSGTAPVGKNVFEKLSFRIPQSVKADTADGVIKMAASIGDYKHEESFPFRVHAVESGRGTLAVFDPAGKTKGMLQRLGYTVTDWTGKNEKLVVIGREALSRQEQPPADLSRYVQAGGRVVIMEQAPEWLRSCGWRVSRQVDRRAWPLGQKHPVTSGLTADDLRDWTGSGTLVSERDEIKDGEAPVTPFGWHWGNRGSVSSGAIEKPHHAGWTPILECGFDLQYTPLMELTCGSGKVVWSQLDLTDNVAAGDPVAQRLTCSILKYAETASVDARRKTIYVGKPEYAALLKEMGLVFTSAQQLGGNEAGLAIIGPAAQQNEAEINAFCKAGGRVVMLAQEAGQPALGVTITATQPVPAVKKSPNDRYSVYNLSSPEQLKSLFHGSVSVPDWQEAMGISVSEVHFRTFHQANVVTAGAEIGADGLLARKPIGKGMVVWCQLAPLSFNTTEEPYFRFTKWRQTRGIAQLLTNLGATFEGDAQTLSARPSRMPLAGTMWKARLTQKLPPVNDWAQRRSNQPISDEAKALVGTDVQDADWQAVTVPNNWDSYGKEWQGIDGECVYRRTVVLPSSWAGKDLILELGRFENPKKTLDDQDDTFFNGVRVGGGNDYWDSRRYTVPGTLVKEGANVLAIRLFDKIGDAGIYTMPQCFFVRLKEEKLLKLYDSDYRDDWLEGDEPYRWVRW